MEHNHFIAIRPDTKVSDLIDRYPMMILMLEHLNINLGLHDKDVNELCAEHEIPVSLFQVIGNLFNGAYPDSHQINSGSDIDLILMYLENSHKHYVTEKFPLLTSYIAEIVKVNPHPEIELLKKFFDDYLDEVGEHLEYENSIVFPYVKWLLKKDIDPKLDKNDRYSISEYRGHHDDIEEKLTDLKKLLISYLPPHNDMKIRRRLLLTLNELEFDLHIHSLIEEVLLIPIVEKLEKSLT